MFSSNKNTANDGNLIKSSQYNFIEALRDVNGHLLMH